MIILSEVNKKHIIVQEFETETEFIETISVVVSRSMFQTLAGFSTFELLDEKGRTIFKNTCRNIDVIKESENNIKRYILPINSPVQKYKIYKLKIWSNSQIGNGLYVYYENKVDDLKSLKLNGNYIKGNLLLNMNYRDSDNLPISVAPIQNYTSGLISVVIPHYNRKQYIEKTIKSISDQTYNFIEVIIVDDFSDEEQFNDIKRLQDKYPMIKHIIRHKENKGAPASRNTGMRKANGEFIFFCDCDIVLYKNSFKNMIQKIHDNPQCAWCYGNFKWGSTKMIFGDWGRWDFTRGNCSSTMSLIRRDVCPHWDESILRLQDWDLFLTMYESGLSGVWLNQYIFTTPKIDGITENSISYNQAVKTLKDKHKKTWKKQ